jgi:predicted nucleic acid-binding protein
MALAKVGGLDALFRLYPEILTAPAVYAEVVTEGLRVGAPDAALLDLRYRSRELAVISPMVQSLPVPELLGPGEQQSIQLAIEHRANWLLIDDLDARRAAHANLAAARVETGLKGTLGVILSAHEHGHLSKEKAFELLALIRQRQDIWISDQLCERATAILSRN